MGIFETIILSLTLAIDATAVSITNGLVYQRLSKKRVLLSSLLFGLFQGLMPLAGYYLTSLTSLDSQVENFVSKIDHWVAFALLLFLGAKMIWDGIKEWRRSRLKCEEETMEQASDLPIGEMFLQGVATSIDAFAVGISIYASSHVIGEVSKGLSIWWMVLIIAIITFGLALLGSFFGKKMGCLFKKIAPFVGGVVLIAIGISIVVEHMVS